MFRRLKVLRPPTLGAIFALSLGMAAGSHANAALLVEYNFDGNANDSSGNGYNGSLQGDAGFAAGQFGQALQLDGSGDVVNVALPTQTFSAFTIELWANSTSSSPSNDHLISLNDANNFIVLWNQTSNSVSGYSTGLSNVNLVGSFSPPIVAGEWFHLAYTWDGLEKKLFKDGQLIGSTAATGTLTPIDASNPLSQAELGFFTDNASSVPEPGVFAILGLGFAAIGYARRKRAA